jgi:hypothetical protein
MTPASMASNSAPVEVTLARLPMVIEVSGVPVAVRVTVDGDAATGRVPVIAPRARRAAPNAASGSIAE